MQIKISTEPPDLLSPECLAVGFFSDERPPRGLCGLADWRLNGLVSNLMAAGRISGALHENVMIETGGRIPSPRLILHGLGPLHELSCDRLHRAGVHLARTALGIRCGELALDIPGVPRTELDMTQMTEALIRGSSARCWRRPPMPEKCPPPACSRTRRASKKSSSASTDTNSACGTESPSTSSSIGTIIRRRRRPPSQTCGKGSPL